MDDWRRLVEREGGCQFKLLIETTPLEDPIKINLYKLTPIADGDSWRERGNVYQAPISIFFLVSGYPTSIDKFMLNYYEIILYSSIAPFDVQSTSSSQGFLVIQSQIFIIILLYIMADGDWCFSAGRELDELSWVKLELVSVS
jgi:hypothetical protein